MTTMTTSGRVPEFTLGWRMRLAIDSADLSVQQMAENLGYSRSTISRWLNDQDQPRPAITAQWALVTGVDRTRLEKGTSTTPTPPGDGEKDAALRKLTQAKRSRRGPDTPGSVTLRYLLSA